MRLAIAHCFREPSVGALLLEPLVTNERARRFYERLGFERIERRMSRNDDCYVYRLERARWENGSPSAC